MMTHPDALEQAATERRRAFLDEAERSRRGSTPTNILRRRLATALIALARRLVPATVGGEAATPRAHERPAIGSARP